MRFDYPDLSAALVQLASDTPRSIGLGGQMGLLAREHPDRLAAVCGDDRRTFAELDTDATRVARALADRGVGAGSWVAIALPNSVHFTCVAIAAWKLGATAVPVSYRMPDVERSAFLELAAPAITVLAPGAPVTAGSDITIDALVAAARSCSGEPLPDVPAAPWKAIGSGGSTGRPKLIVDPGPGPLRRGAAEMFGMRAGGVELIAGPLYHNGPFAWSVIQLMAGGSLVLLERFDAETYLRTIEEERVTWSFVVPTMLHRIVELPTDVVSRYDLSSLEVVLHSAAPCPPWLKRRAIELFGADRVWEYYGAAEVAGTMIRGDDWLEHEPSVGRPLPGLEIVVRDDEGAQLPSGEVGEIWVRPPGGPTFSYRGAEARTDGGLVSVGDLGWLDDDGYLFISDRRTDLIITGGANVYPAEVESAVLEHPAVADVAVVGLRHPEWGQAVHAIVEPADVGAPPSTDELAAFCRERLAAYKLPKSFEIVDALPRDPSGKLRRSALRDEREAAAG